MLFFLLNKLLLKYFNTFFSKKFHVLQSFAQTIAVVAVKTDNLSIAAAASVSFFNIRQQRINRIFLQYFPF